MALLRPASTEFGCDRPEIGPAWAMFDKHLQNLARNPESTPHTCDYATLLNQRSREIIVPPPWWPEIWPTSEHNWSKSASDTKFRRQRPQNLAEPGSTLADTARDPARSVTFSPDSINFGRFWADIGRNWPMSVPTQPQFGQISSAGFGQTCPNRPTPARSRPNLGELDVRRNN